MVQDDDLKSKTWVSNQLSQPCDFIAFKTAHHFVHMVQLEQGLHQYFLNETTVSLTCQTVNARSQLFPAGIPYLGEEGVCALGRIVLGVTAHVSTTDIFDGHVLDVEANVVSGESLLQSLVVHLDGLHL